MVEFVDLPAHRPMPPGGYERLNAGEAQERVVSETLLMDVHILPTWYAIRMSSWIALALDVASPVRLSQRHSFSAERPSFFDAPQTSAFNCLNSGPPTIDRVRVTLSVHYKSHKVVLECRQKEERTVHSRSPSMHEGDLPLVIIVLHLIADLLLRQGAGQVIYPWSYKTSRNRPMPASAKKCISIVNSSTKSKPAMLVRGVHR